MLSKEDNELITKTDRGTPMGELFRRFWIPALLAEELPGADCNPVRVRIMGEDLVAFRDSKGRPGVIDAYCPHRGAPMFFGRNEEEGIRCLYHGWKFDVNGDCMEMPNIPHGETAKKRMHTMAYPTIESAGMVWVYMGPEDRKPPFPEFPYTTEVPKEQVYVTRYEINCNWLQAMEGDYDPSHAMFVHSTLGDNSDVARDFSQQGGRLKPDQPVPTTLAVVDTPIGVVRVSPRGLVDGTAAVSAAQVVMPSFPSAGLAQPGVYSSNIRIPIDNEHENHFRLRWTRRGFTEKEIYDYKFGGYAFPLHEPGTYLAKQRKDNDYGYDPVLQRQFNFSGVVPFPTQDLMMIEHQWGAIAKREREHLVASDRIIIHVRRRLLEMAKNLANGIEPEEPFLMKGIRQDATAPVILNNAGRVSPDEMDAMLADLNTVKVTKSAPTDEDAEEIWAPSRSEQGDQAKTR
jgi:phenylpropionate dioxygenase-like ring-hydroxylating dioxygenase large terminal subunit